MFPELNSIFNPESVEEADPGVPREVVEPEPEGTETEMLLLDLCRLKNPEEVEEPGEDGAGAVDGSTAIEKLLLGLMATGGEAADEGPEGGGEAGVDEAAMSGGWEVVGVTGLSNPSGWVMAARAAAVTVTSLTEGETDSLAGDFEGELDRLPPEITLGARMGEEAVIFLGMVLPPRVCIHLAFSTSDWARK